MSPRFLFATASVAASVLVAAPAQAAQQNLAEVAVSGRAPTQIAIPLAGKDVAAVRQEVRGAARTVCRNAVANRELTFDDVLWCRQATQAKAMRRYAAIVAPATRTAEAAPILVLSAR
jgi:hypothetical protein